MTEKEIIERNKLVAENNLLIAEFMELLWDKDWKKYGKLGIGGDGKGGFGWYVPANMGYHSSFDWLMPVVEKIESLTSLNSLLYYVSIEGDRCEIRKNDFHPYDDLISLKCVHKNKLQSTWEAVIEFIQWYNTQTKHISTNESI